MKVANFSLATLVAGALLIGTGVNAKDNLSFENVDYKYAVSKLGSGMRFDTKSTFIDARNAAAYEKGTIPSAFNVEGANFDSQIAIISKVPKENEVIVFCEDSACKEKFDVAQKLKDNGYKNVKIYKDGYAEWSKSNYIEVGVNVVKEAQEDNTAVLIDARPHAKFKQETIPGAISIVDVQMKELKGRFPSDKSTPIITFCQGYDCKKSHNLAAYLKELGYTNVSNYSAGVPDWKKAKLKTTKAVCDTNATKPKTGLTNPTFGSLRKGLDVGSVDGVWFKENYETLKDVQIIDVRTKDEIQKGMLKGATHVSIEENSAEDFLKALPDNYIAFYCGSGARAMEAYQKASKAGKKALYLDAAVKCENDVCTIAPNEPLEPSDW